jgi:hypothetical protein
MGASWLLLDYDVVNFRHHVNLDTGDVRLHIVVEPVLEVIPALPYLRYVKLAVAHEGHVGDESRRGQKGGASVALTPCRTSPSSFLKQTTSPIPTCSLLSGSWFMYCEQHPTHMHPLVRQVCGGRRMHI